MKKRTVQIKVYTLFELLTVIGFLFLLLNVTFKMFYDTSKIITRSADRAISSQEILLLSRKWRSVCHDAKGEAIMAVDGGISIGDAKVIAKPGEIVFSRDGVSTKMKLQKNMTPRFSVEVQEGTSAKLAVLDIDWQQGKNRQDSYRMVGSVFVDHCPQKL